LGWSEAALIRGRALRSSGTNSRLVFQMDGGKSSKLLLLKAHAPLTFAYSVPVVVVVVLGLELWNVSIHAHALPS
jgi:hypothetical protein